MHVFFDITKYIQPKSLSNVVTVSKNTQEIILASTFIGEQCFQYLAYNVCLGWRGERIVCLPSEGKPEEIWP